jgi:hypothetical protein
MVHPMAKQGISNGFDDPRKRDNFRNYHQLNSALTWDNVL